METTKRILLQSKGEPIEYPEHWVIDGKVEGDDGETWTAVRKPDGTWWYAVNHIFPPDGGILRLDFDEQITDPLFIMEYERNRIEAKTDAVTAKLP
jgi:hypothetical protein